MSNRIKYFLLAVSLLVNHTLFAQDKIALLIGIGDYAPDTGWEKLSSTNDLALIEDALIKQGFNAKDITVLKDEKLNKNDILNAIQTQLIDKVKAGTVVVFHYSGHGQQVADNNGDELDGLDEALVPYDSPKHFSKGKYEGEKLIRDDDLGALFYEIRKKAGAKGQLLVLMDACHSGTGTRSFLTPRGTDIIMADSPKNKTQSIQDNKRQEKKAIKDDKTLAPIISFFSSRAGQYSYEKRGTDGKAYGVFSYAFSKCFANASKQSSYRALLDKINFEVQGMTSIQSPQAEGNLDLPLLSNQLLGEAKYFEVKEIIDKQILQINAGTLHGVHEGATIGFYPLDTRDVTTAQPYAVGKVIYTDIIQADVEFEQAQDMSQLRTTWAYLLEKNYGNLEVQVQLDIADKVLQDKLKKVFATSPIIKIVPKLPDVLIQQKENQSLQLISKDGNSIFSYTSTEDVQLLKEKLMGYAQAEYLRQLEINNPLLQAKLEILQNNKVCLSTKAYHLGEDIQVKITNTGKEPFYFNLLDIMPDNAIAPIDLTNGEHTIEELKLEAGKSFTSVVMEVGEPLGIDVFKLVVSSKPIDLSLIKGTGNRNYSDLNPLEALLNSTNTAINKRGTTTNIPTSFEVNVEAVIFEINK